MSLTDKDKVIPSDETLKAIVIQDNIDDYIRWGLTPKEAEDWVVHGIYPTSGIMNKVRSNRNIEKKVKAMKAEFAKPYSNVQERFLRALKAMDKSEYDCDSADIECTCGADSVNGKHSSYCDKYV
jgi:hypothetical protein